MTWLIHTYTGCSRNTGSRSHRAAVAGQRRPSANRLLRYEFPAANTHCNRLQKHYNTLQCTTNSEGRGQITHSGTNSPQPTRTATDCKHTRTHCHALQIASTNRMSPPPVRILSSSNSLQHMTNKLCMCCTRFDTVQTARTKRKSSTQRETKRTIHLYHIINSKQRSEIMCRVELWILSASRINKSPDPVF